MDDWNEFNSLESKLDRKEVVIKGEPEEFTEGCSPFVVNQFKTDPSPYCVGNLVKNEIKMDNCDDSQSFEIKLEQEELIIKDEPIRVSEENKSFIIKSETNLSTLSDGNCVVKVEENVGNYTNEIKLEDEFVIKDKPEEVEERHISPIALESDRNPLTLWIGDTEIKVDPLRCSIQELDKIRTCYIKVVRLSNHVVVSKMSKDRNSLQKGSFDVINTQVNLSIAKTVENPDSHRNEIKLEDELIIKDELEDLEISDIQIRVDPSISSIEELEKIRTCYVTVMKLPEDRNFIVQKNNEKKHEDDNCKAEESSISDFDEEIPLSVLKKHILHHKNTKYKCGKNGKRFGQNNDLKLHKQTRTGEDKKSFKCQQCIATFRSKSHLKRHMLIHKKFKCQHCDKSFKQKDNLKTHMWHHEGKKLFKCQQCNKSFTQSNSLKAHMRHHEGKKLFKCQQCNKTFSHSSKLKTHMSIHNSTKSFKCQQCDKCFSRSSKMKRHYKLIHERTKLFKCQKCNKSFSEDCSLKRHMLFHEAKKHFKCSECSKRFVLKDGLKRHMLMIHDAMKPFKCEQCHKRFAQKKSLTRHKRHKLNHNGEKPFKCEQCNKPLAERKSLERHKLKHKSEEPLKCI